MPDPGQPTPNTSPVRSPRAWAILLVVTVIGLVADLASKSVAFQKVAGFPVGVVREKVLERVASGGSPNELIPQHDPVKVIPGLLDFTLVLNHGAVFGIGAGKRLVFIGFTAFAMVFALFLFSKWTIARDWKSHAAIGLLISGGLGNLYDRWVYACVRDFIHPLPGVRLPFGWSWPWGGNEVWPYVSNVADLFLIIGIAVLIWRSLRPLK